MKKLGQAILYLLALIFAGCASTGAQLAAPVDRTLDHATATARSVYVTGSAPQDGRVKTIMSDLGTAKQQVATITKDYDQEKAAHAKDRHQLAIVYGALACAGLMFLAPILMKLLPLFAL